MANSGTTVEKWAKSLTRWDDKFSFASEMITQIFGAL